ncbi:MAG: PAS domain-containing protein [Anaerolineales bacterium]|nr:PAS domain-containing protein [Anaerolineales bacterium]
MTPIFTLLSNAPYPGYPQGWMGWLSLLVLAGVIVVLLIKWRSYNRLSEPHQRRWLIILLLAAPVASLFLGLQLPAGRTLPPPEIHLDTPGAVIMIFSALPWMLAAGILGPLPATAIALLTGILRFLWSTHSPFTGLELALLAVLFSAAVCQRYRTTLFRLLRHPLITALLLMTIYPLIELTLIVVNSRGMLVNRLDYALSNLPGATLALGVELVIAAIICEIILRVAPATWITATHLEPSPAEKSLQTRFLVSMAPLALILILTLMVGDWYIAGNAARLMLKARMANAADIAAKNVPYFLESGQSLITQLSLDPRLLSSRPNELYAVLAEQIKTVPFFSQLAVIDRTGNLVAAYPSDDYTGKQAPIEEQLGIQLALNNEIPYQTFTIPPAAGQSTAQISFVAALFGSNGSVQGVLVGRSDMKTNPITKPVLASLNNLADSGGQGFLLDENGRILVHPDPNLVMTVYDGRIEPEPAFYDGTAPDGTRQMVYSQPAEGRPWSVILTVPASSVQQLALDIATPLLGMILLLSVISIIILRLGVGMVTSNLQNLASEAGLLAEGRLDQPLPVDGEDEVGYLRRAFEQMRVSLKARLDELNRLLVVSQGVASSLEISEAVQPVLEAAQASGASMARVVLTPSVVPELDGDSSTPISFTTGPSQQLYHELDEQILALTRQQERLVLPNLNRPRLLNFTPGAPRPESIIAIALRHENLYYGALWMAYDQSHAFSEEQVRFLVTLGGHAALAAANARLFQTTEIGRQRLAAILASSPDPVLVTDQRDCLLLANPAAWQVLGLGRDTGEGQPIDQVVSQTDLLDLLRSTSDEKQSRELTLPDGRIFLATATPVLAEGQRMGRVCVLRDVTHFKELDALKSDFVSTVSHDLRSPLTLMRGYATMLEMVGQLNEQQTSYVRKIITGVESMSRMVNNLLDLGRIEAGVGLQLEMIQVQDVLERVVGAMQLPAAQKRIQLNTEIPYHSVPLIEADQALLQQALQNLIENAIKYTRPEGKVLVRVDVKPIGMVFEVIDSGVGISPVDMPRLFEKFYRGAQQASKDQRGTGLGLAIVKSIAERHGGRVWAESQLGKGSVFYLAIPLRQPRREREI